MYLIQDDILSKCCMEAFDRVLVAFSGGPDSLALLLELKRLQNDGKIQSLGAAHLNHMIRGESADNDASFCSAFCLRLNIPFYTERFDVPRYAAVNHLSIETAARIIRYRFLENVRRDNNYSCIATGHHKNDQAETVLLHLIRGTGTDGLAGMRYRSELLVRPLLDHSKEDILRYLEERNQIFCLDESNDDLTIERNAIRNTVIPTLARINPRIIDSLTRTAVYAGYDADYLEGISSAFYQQITDRHEIAVLEEAVRFRVLKRYLPYCDFDSSDIQSLDTLLSAQTGTVRNLKYGFRAWTDANKLHVDKEESEAYSFSLLPGSKVHLSDKLIISEYVNQADIPCDKNEVYLDLDKTVGTLIVRSPLPGDRFNPFGMKGSKLLSDYFSDRKIPRFKRNSPLIVDSEGIIAVMGFTVDERVKITDDSKNILHISIKEVCDELGK